MRDSWHLKLFYPNWGGEKMEPDLQTNQAVQMSSNEA